MILNAAIMSELTCIIGILNYFRLRKEPAIEIIYMVNIGYII